MGLKVLYRGSEVITRNREGVVSVFGVWFGAALLIQGETKPQIVER
tara:strand:- start:1203 stop:1340 length:138 start_codon:yes stop_codon:yes gene_type:complete